MSFVLTSGDCVKALRPEGVELDGWRLRIVSDDDGALSVQRHGTAQSTWGESWSDGIIASSHEPTRALIQLAEAFTTSRASRGSDA